MPRITPEEAAAKWSERLGGSTEQIRRGIERVERAPGVEAARQRQAWLQRVQASQEKWARNVARVSREDWQQATINKGLPRVAQGAQEAQPKVATFLGELFAHQATLEERIRQMPKGTPADSRQRMIAWFDGMSAFRRTGGPGS